MPWHPEKKRIIAPGIDQTPRQFSIMTATGQVPAMVFGLLLDDGVPDPERSIVYEIENPQRGLWFGYLLAPEDLQNGNHVWKRSTFAPHVGTTHGQLTKLIVPTITDLWNSLWINIQDPTTRIERLRHQLTEVDRQRSLITEELGAWQNLA